MLVSHNGLNPILLGRGGTIEQPFSSPLVECGVERTLAARVRTELGAWVSVIMDGAIPIVLIE